jgi:hypothetical protein
VLHKRNDRGVRNERRVSTKSLCEECEKSTLTGFVGLQKAKPQDSKLQVKDQTHIWTIGPAS